MDDTQTLTNPERLLHVPVPGGTVACFRSGSGHPMLYLHSAGDGGTWTEFHQQLAAQSTVFAPDHPGFGNSDDFTAITSMDRLVDHYLAFLDAARLDVVDLVGTSFGGWTAAALAIRSPARFRRMVLLAPAGLYDAEDPIADILSMAPDELIPALYHDDELVRSILATPPTEDQVAGVTRAMAALRRIAGPRLEQPDLEGRLSQVRTPTRIVAAMHDRIVPPSHTRRYAAAVPGAELMVVKDCGHSLYGEQLDAVAEAVTTFLA
ncbi:alpha/beta fold hydrolase [Rhodococcus pyridinivorans]|uniref:Alpha/beta fold hydrolase n=1 Tax=Rhodococcus pyridinivorans TaxID=103816 RepID=A0A7M2XKZ7_9NOCA|nr:alpha/beta fold hydrolase [Rhodococcus pyridinivorans]MCD5422140.1 alpha/beta fold hydrolase [Rhodococcus pyridinivorans]QOV98367.1 alpha/beta fold hydrolase [Rhodococcus pyridinivorans]UTM36840.1 alpha/beta fold hydrolase [Rhodococcus pyridinivorans]